MIGVQLTIAGFQLPKRYIWERWRDMAVLLLRTFSVPIKKLGFLTSIAVMTLMWLFTATCVYLIIPKITFVSIPNGCALTIILTAR